MRKIFVHNILLIVSNVPYFEMHFDRYHEQNVKNYSNYVHEGAFPKYLSTEKKTQQSKQYEFVQVLVYHEFNTSRGRKRHVCVSVPKECV